MNNDERRDLILKLCCGIGSDPAFRALTQLVFCMAAELDEARQALGEAWLAGGVSVAEGIKRKTAALEHLALSASKTESWQAHTTTGEPTSQCQVCDGTGRCDDGVPCWNCGGDGKV